MLLRKIALHGFKSFADRLDLSFEPGITAIVGPNGSGKSNISDAVKWVLGESSARELRGARMEDVIFAGSAQRRSLGMAEVTLTLDNEDGFLPVDYGEVSVTRRLYRSGESEFLLNHSPCRLRDIQELFMDSGVGRNAYALLSMADVEAVLSANPEERRRLFEEAAGVAKFRAKKAEALRKLGETEQNLARVGDILAELSNQLGPLSEKARRAERHAALSGELREVEVGLLAGLLQEAQGRVETAGEELTRREMAAAEGEAVLRQAEARVVQARLAVAQVDADREETARQLLAVATELERIEGELRAAGERRQRWAEEQARLEAERTLLAGRREAAAGLAGERAESCAAGQAALEACRKVVAEQTDRLAEATRDLRQREEELERKKGELIEGMNEAAQFRNELRGLEASREATEAHRQRLARVLEEALRAVGSAQEALGVAEDQRTAALEAARRAQEGFVREEKEAARSAEELRRGEEQLRACEGELARLRSRHQVLSDWQRSREGYAEGPRAVLAEHAAGRLDGVLGTVAELLSVPAELERAVETALGNGLQDVVVKDEGVAQRGIRFLKEKGAGRATFLPLALLAPRPLGEQERRALAGSGGDGFLGVADELVQYPEAIRPAVEYLLGRVLVTRDLDTALRVGRSSGLRYLVVTVDGEVVRPGGAVTGGREERTRGLLRRQRELAEVEQELRAAEESRARLLERLAELTETADALRRETEAQEKLWRAGEEAAAKAEREVAVRGAELRQAEGAAERARKELTALEAGEGRSREEELKQRLAAAEEARRNLEEEIGRETEEVRQAAQRREEVVEVLTALRVELAEREKDAAVAAAELARAQAEVAAMDREGEEAGARAADLLRRAEETQAWLDRLEAQRETLARQRVEAENRASDLGEKRALCYETLAAAEAEADQARQRQALLQQSVGEAEVAAARAEMDAENAGAKLAAEWGIGREEALGLAGIAAGAREAAAEQAESLRRRLKALGAVDPESIAEHARLSERHGFLSRQYADLMAARETLTDVLEEIETATTRRFSATFTAVAAEFSSLFRRVFGGGRAELKLTDPDNPAESGIEIEAQPPGKKNQSLLSLSSGERTMTAVALLFAMMRVRPAPFCVMDEVDAALDEANLARFVSLVQEFAATMQFIVITHRRQTMEAAGVLYGVTMEEPGTSRLVSVRLSEAG